METLAALGLSDDLFVQVAAILVVSAVAGTIAVWLRLPLVIAYVAVGVAVGPSAPDIVQPGGELELLAQLGIALLLFVVGLKLDIHVIRTLGPVSVAVGGAQVALTAAGGFLLALALLVVLAVLMRWALTPLLHALAPLPDLLVLFAIAWAVALGALGDELGFGVEVGAFLGGVSIASTPYREAIGSRLITIRDFLLLFFFIDLGSRVDLGQLADELWIAALLSVFVLVAKPIIVIGLLGAMRYRKRVSLESGLARADQRVLAHPGRPRVAAVGTSTRTRPRS